VEEISFIVEPTIHGAGARGGLMGVLENRVGIGVKGCCLKNLGEYLIFGYGRVQKSEMGDVGEKILKAGGVGVNIFSIKNESGLLRWWGRGEGEFDVERDKVRRAW
jgi:hypothetical protein